MKTKTTTAILYIERKKKTRAAYMRVFLRLFIRKVRDEGISRVLISTGGKNYEGGRLYGERN